QTSQNFPPRPWFDRPQWGDRFCHGHYTGSKHKHTCHYPTRSGYTLSPMTLKPSIRKVTATVRSCPSSLWMETASARSVHLHTWSQTPLDRTKKSNCI